MSMDKNTMRGSKVIRTNDPLPDDFPEPALEDLQELRELEEPREAEWPDFPNTDNEADDYVYHLQYPLGTPLEMTRVRLPKVLRARHLRHSTMGSSDAEGLFYMVASAAKIAVSVLDTIDARDWYCIQKIMERITTKNSEAVRRVMTPKDG